MMNEIDDQPDEKFPEERCIKILTLNSNYNRWIDIYRLKWDIICPNKQILFIYHLNKYYNDEWIKHNIDTDWDDY